ncbi:MAG: GntR family transcriptional regulator [Actinomycetota bacterium]
MNPRRLADPELVGHRKVDIAYSEIKRALITGIYEFGAELSVTALAEELGASRQPVMEALKRLETERFVEIVPQVGCRVAVPLPGEVEDFYEVFATMEGLVSRLAAERRTDEDLRQLKDAVNNLTSSLRGNSFDLARYADLNREFHGLVHRSARSREARLAAEMYWDRSDFMIASTRPPFWKVNLSRARSEHKELYEAIRGQDASFAQQKAEQHIRSFGAAVVAHLASAHGVDGGT